MIDKDLLAAWLDDRGLPGAGSPLFVTNLHGGSQNDVYEVRRDELHAVLRTPPPHAPLDRDAGILREWRVLEALEGTDVPHTAALGVSPGPEVLGRPFYLMGFIDGWSPVGRDGRWPEPFESDAEARHGLAFELVEGAAQLARVDWQAQGLEGFGRPDGFHERQVDRWESFLARVKNRDLPGYEVAAAWLRTHRPSDYVPGIMHGDYSFANVMYDHGAPARLAAVIDWEMATVGDPKLDLAWALHSWPETPEPAGDPTDALNALTRGMPPRSALLERYVDVSGRQVDDFDYYLVLAKWKLGVVLEQGFQRAGDDEKLQVFGPIVLDLFEQAAQIAESTDYR